MLTWKLHDNEAQSARLFYLQHSECMFIYQDERSAHPSQLPVSQQLLPVSHQLLPVNHSAAASQPIPAPDQPIAAACQSAAA